MRMREIAMEGDDVECEKKEKKKKWIQKRKERKAHNHKNP